MECKAGDALRRTASMLSAVKSLKLKKLFVVYPGERDYAIDDTIEVFGIRNVEKLLAAIKTS
jgi:hypothetical protein